MNDHVSRQNMTTQLRSFASRHNIVCLQETHGEDAELQLFLASALPHWHFFVSGSRNQDDLFAPGAGGVAVAVSPSSGTLSHNTLMTFWSPGGVLLSLSILTIV